MGWWRIGCEGSCPLPGVLSWAIGIVRTPVLTNTERMISLPHLSLLKLTMCDDRRLSNEEVKMYLSMRLRDSCPTLEPGASELALILGQNVFELAAIVTVEHRKLFSGDRHFQGYMSCSQNCIQRKKVSNSKSRSNVHYTQSRKNTLVQGSTVTIKQPITSKHSLVSELTMCHPLGFPDLRLLTQEVFARSLYRQYIV